MLRHLEGIERKFFNKDQTSLTKPIFSKASGVKSVLCMHIGKDRWHIGINRARAVPRQEDSGQPFENTMD
jgi:hypothetical protein